MTGSAAPAPSTVDVVVVCRPDQMRQAATVLSCMAADRWPPLFVLERPPCSEARYRTLYGRYKRMCDRRDEALGTAAAQAAWLGKTKAPGWKAGWSNEEIDRRAKALTPYRRWIKRHRLLGDVVRGLPLGRAIVLFEATAEDRGTIDPYPSRGVETRRTPLLADDVEWLHLPADADAPLWQRAWQLLRPDEPLPADALDVVGHPVALVAGLHRARRLGRPLTVIEGAPPKGCVVEPSTSAAPAEAVVVEADDHAGLLAAVGYALRQDAVFCVAPRVSVRAIERARRAVADWYESGPSAAGEPPIATMQAAVARAVPRAVVDAVGGLPLTAWTAGVPYHLLETTEAEWGDKPIGLMTDDSLLLATVELFAAPVAGRRGLPPDGARRVDRPSARLHVVFDPGAFTTDETAVVSDALGADAGCVLLAQGPAATQMALIASGGAPLEILHFNTHGESDAVVLDDLELPGYKLLQRVTLGSHPLVFNNSCQSWTGVGREFLIAGARGYVGTLWPVLSDEAARLAGAAMRRLVAGGETVAASVRGNAVDAATAKAYVVAGPVSARLRPADPTLADPRGRLVANATLLCEMGRFLCAQGWSPESPVVAPVLAVLVARSEALAAEIDARWPEPDGATLPLLTQRLALATQFTFAVEANVRRCVDLALHGLRLVGPADDTRLTDIDTKAACWLACARVSRKLERWGDVVALLTVSIDAQTRAGRDAADERLDRCDAFQRLGRTDQALADAQHAHAAFAALVELARSPEQRTEARRGAMLASGRLAGLYRRSGQLDAALAAMREGHRTAVALGDLSEQAAFKLDESAILRNRVDASGAVSAATRTAAIAAADAAVSAARQAHSDAKELEALGGLTLALRAAGEWDRARATAEDGLAAARRGGQAGSAVAFLCDLSAIARARDDIAAACGRLIDAAAIVAAATAPAQARRLLIDADALLTSVRTWPVQRAALRITVMLVGTLPPPERVVACMEAMRRLLTRIAVTGWAASRDPLWRSTKELAPVRDAQGERFADQGRFLLDVVGACYSQAKGLTEAAQAEAARLDGMSAGAFQLVSFMAGGGTESVASDGGEHPAWTAARLAAAAI